MDKLLNRIPGWRLLMMSTSVLKALPGKLDIKNKKDCKDQETIQSSTTPDPGCHMDGKVTKIQ